MKLKDIVIDIAIDPRKLTEYALNLDNPKGRDKAIMFRFHLGFTRDNYQLLLDKIKIAALEAEATLQKIDIYGQRYQVDLEITGIQPEQLEIVRTGWIVEHNSDIARLVTLYVRKRK
ncbi:MAG: DUF6883 domain-containing protein [Waterburya sp.]